MPDMKSTSASVNERLTLSACVLAVMITSRLCAPGVVPV
jgi:hypothetical protein